MKLSLVSRLGFGLILLLALNQYVEAAPVSGSTKEAYATLLYGDEFVLGVRVLGKSIRDTRTARDMVVLVSDGVSDYAKKLLKVLSFFLYLILPMFVVNLKYVTPFYICG